VWAGSGGGELPLTRWLLLNCANRCGPADGAVEEHISVSRTALLEVHGSLGSRIGLFRMPAVTMPQQEFDADPGLIKPPRADQLRQHVAFEAAAVQEPRRSLEWWQGSRRNWNLNDLAQTQQTQHPLDSGPIGFDAHTIRCQSY